MLQLILSCHPERSRGICGWPVALKSFPLPTSESRAARRKMIATASARLLLLRGYELLHHSFSHQVGRQQTLRQNEVVELLLIELGSFRRQRLLCVFA